MNLNDHQKLRLPKYGSSSWKIEELGLSLEYKAVKESFAFGEPLSERRRWKNVQREVNVFDCSKEDTGSEIVLRPLQIRSFRVSW